MESELFRYDAPVGCRALCPSFFLLEQGWWSPLLLGFLASHTLIFVWPPWWVFRQTFGLEIPVITLSGGFRQRSTGSEGLYHDRPYITHSLWIIHLCPRKASLTDIKSRTKLEDNRNEYRGMKNSEKVCKSVKGVSMMMIFTSDLRVFLALLGSRTEIGVYSHLFDKIPKPYIVATTTFLSAYSAANNLKLAHHLFFATPFSIRDTVSYNVMIAAFSHSHDGNAALHLFLQNEKARLFLRPFHLLYCLHRLFPRHQLQDPLPSVPLRRLVSRMNFLEPPSLLAISRTVILLRYGLESSKLSRVWRGQTTTPIAHVAVNGGCRVSKGDVDQGYVSMFHGTRSWACEIHVGPHESRRPNCVSCETWTRSLDYDICWWGNVSRKTACMSKSRRPICVSYETWTRMPFCETRPVYPRSGPPLAHLRKRWRLWIISSSPHNFHFGESQSEAFKDRYSLRLSWLTQHFGHPYPNVQDPVYWQRHARAWICIFLGEVLFVDAGFTCVNIRWLTYLRDVQAIGFVALLQLWVWERIPKRRPTVIPSVDVVWMTQHNALPMVDNVGVIKKTLDCLRRRDFIWCPYSADVIAQLPDECRHDHWSVFIDGCTNAWNNRRNSCFQRIVPQEELLSSQSDYMRWFVRYRMPRIDPASSPHHAMGDIVEKIVYYTTDDIAHGLALRQLNIYDVADRYVESALLAPHPGQAIDIPPLLVPRSSKEARGPHIRRRVEPVHHVVPPVHERISGHYYGLAEDTGVYPMQSQEAVHQEYPPSQPYFHPGPEYHVSPHHVPAHDVQVPPSHPAVTDAWLSDPPPSWMRDTAAMFFSPEPTRQANDLRGGEGRGIYNILSRSRGVDTYTLHVSQSKLRDMQKSNDLASPVSPPRQRSFATWTTSLAVYESSIACMNSNNDSVILKTIELLRSFNQWKKTLSSKLKGYLCEHHNFDNDYDRPEVYLMEASGILFSLNLLTEFLLILYTEVPRGT
ncbi:hypothetical protein Fmac_001551 [Flemingia macrophylla]|uniref:Aminotransferase-like plant mobile domain-containing protein n=1 Tax=Flemingia macrophylla TaxID=520843 RepID=A0ABD1NI06_9FABA